MLAEERGGPLQGTLSQNQVRADAKGEKRRKKTRKKRRKKNKKKKKHCPSPCSTVREKLVAHFAPPIALYADKNILTDQKALEQKEPTLTRIDSIIKMPSSRELAWIGK